MDEKTVYEHYSEVFIYIMNVIYKFMEDGKKICTITNKGKILNIKPNNFRRIISGICPDESPKDVLMYLKKYRFIICDPNSRNYTCVRKIDNKPTRMISIDKQFIEDFREANTKIYVPKKA